MYIYTIYFSIINYKHIFCKARNQKRLQLRIKGSWLLMGFWLLRLLSCSYRSNGHGMM